MSATLDFALALEEEELVAAQAPEVIRALLPLLVGAVAFKAQCPGKALEGLFEAVGDHAKR